ncbi:hypothetical protein EMPG_09399 [Blastomyces silverae]|uniref:Uncharacterized protein n=1 Tax=Blastomyces silverae TaxID=2060906 RepID=A0A0H1BQG7_9EURO|nr:hypothetical protein EMPG_09399 [Blastomyces silverae]
MAWKLWQIFSIPMPAALIPTTATEVATMEFPYAKLLSSKGYSWNSRRNSVGADVISFWRRFPACC